MPSEAEAVALTRAYGNALAALTDDIASSIARAWDRIGKYDTVNVADWERVATPIIDVGRARAAALAEAYTTRLFEVLPAGIALSELRGAQDLLVPFQRVWRHLADGDQWIDAVAAGRSEVENLARRAVNATARSAAGQAAPNAVGWRRVPVGDSCRWCARVSTQRYHTEESASLNDQHDNCDCLVLPITGDVDPGHVINKPLLDALKFGDPPSYVTPDGSPADRT